MDVTDRSDGEDGLSKSRSSSFSIVSASDVPEADAPQDQRNDKIKSVPELQAWLQPTDYLSPGNEYMKHVAAYVPGTGDWLRQTAEFCHWLGEKGGDNRSRSLWVKGVPGTGKSVVAASTVQSLHKAGAPVLFFFFRQIVNTNHTPTCLVRDWCAQLLSYDRTFQRELSDLSRRHLPNGIEMTLLWEALCSAFKRLEKVFCVADALDEMDETYWDTFIPLLKSLPSASNGLKLLLTSRPIPRLEIILQDSNIGKIRLNPTLIYPDIITYTNVRLLALPETVKLTTEKEDKVRDAICERANGLFLQARLMIDNLTTGLLEGSVTDETLPYSLDKLPRNLRELYVSMLDEHSRRSGVAQEQQFKVLTCVISSSRPLRLIELASMMCWMRGDAPDEALRVYKNLVRASCGRLLEILEDETVSVIHHSFTEFLRDENRTDSAFPIVGSLDAKKTLALLCLDYLSACTLPEVVAKIFEKLQVEQGGGSEATDDDDDDDDDSDNDYYSNMGYQDADELTKVEAETALTHLRLQYPLLEYAVTNLVHHLRCFNPTVPLQDEIASRLDKHFESGSPAFMIFLLRHWLSRAFTEVTPLHVAAIMEYEPYVVHLLQQRVAIDAEDNGGRTPLTLACKIVSKDEQAVLRVVEVLLDAKAHPDLPDGMGKKPLHYAVRRVRPDIVRLLLQAGVSPTTPRTRNNEEHLCDFHVETKGDTPLLESTHGAASPERMEIMRMFLPYIEHDTFLLYKMLAWTTEFEVVKEILELGRGRLDLNTLLDGFTLLFRAARKQDPLLVRLLLKHGANPKTRCETGSYYHSDCEFVRIKPSSKEDSGFTALHAWAAEKSAGKDASNDDIAQTFQLLLEAGADVNASTEEDSKTPLHVSVEKPFSYGWSFGHKERDATQARLLLEAGAEPNAHSKYFGTPLHTVQPAWKELVDVLIANGADVNVDCGHGSPLRNLLSRKADNDTGNRKGWYDGMISTAQLLLRHGADIKYRDNAGNTLAHAMIGLLEDKYLDRKQVLELWRVLIDAGSDLNAMNNAGQTPYLFYQTRHFGKCEADVEMFQALKEAGMMLEPALEEKSKILFGIFDWNPELDQLKELLDQGYPIHVLNTSHQTLLHVAVAKFPWHVPIIKLLLNRGTDPLTTDSRGDTLMHALARSGKASPSTERLFKLLLSHGVRPNSRNKAGQLPLHLAAGCTDDISDNNVGTVQNLLSLFLATTPGEVDAADSQGLRPLHYAAAISERFVSQLLEAGADSKVLTNEGVSPLYVACRARESNTVGLLLADYDRQGVRKEWMDKKDAIEGRTPLHVAARSGQEESVRYLLATEHWPDATAVDFAGCTAIHAVAESLEESALWKENRSGKGVDAAGILVHDICRPDKEPSSDWPRVLEQRIESCSGIVTLLVLLGVKHEIKNKYGLTAIEYAKEKKRHDMIAALREAADSMGTSGEIQAPIEEPEEVFEDVPVEEEIEKPEDIFKLPDAQILRILESGKYDLTAPLDQWTHVTLLHQLVIHGKLAILLRLYLEAKRLHTLEHMSQEDNPRTLLMQACERKLPSCHFLLALVSIGLDINEKSNCRESRGEMAKATPLHRLAAGTIFWNIEGVEYLISAGADIEATNTDGETPLAVAVSDDFPDGYYKKATAKLLLEAGANPDAVDQSNKTPLCKASSLDVVQLLLDYRANVHIGNPLHYAIQGNNFEVAQKLLDSGADPNTKGLLHHVASVDKRLSNDDEENEEIKDMGLRFTKLLLQYGASPYREYERNTVLHTIIQEHGFMDPFLQLENLDIEKKGAGSRTLLISACVPTVPPQPYWSRSPPPTACGSPEVALELIARNANVDAADINGRTALHWLCMHPGDFDCAHQSVFNVLVEKSPSLIHETDVEGWTPFHLATAHLHEWTVDRLVALGAHSTMPDPDGNTPLHHFASAMFSEKERSTRASTRFRHLLAQGYDINAKNATGETPLFRFCASRLSDLPQYIIDSQKFGWRRNYNHDEDVSHFAALTVFLEADADLHTTNSAGETLLHATANRRSDGACHAQGDQVKDVVGTFKALVEHGVDAKKEDSRHRTAVDVAVACGHTGIVDIFAPEKRLDEGVPFWF